MKCASCRPLLSKYVDGEATPDEQAQVEAHIGGCPACGTVLAQYRMMSAQVGALPVFTTATIGGGPAIVQSVNDAGLYNTLGNHRFVRFTVGPNARTVTIVGLDGGNPTAGATAHIAYDGSAPAGQYTILVRAEDSPPCVSPLGTHHLTDFSVIVTITGP